MAVDIQALESDYKSKLKAFLEQTKYPLKDDGLISNDIDFRDKGIRMSNVGGTRTSSVDRLLIKPMKGYPLKRGVKLAFDAGLEPKFEVCTSSSDVVGICIDVDDYSGSAIVKPIGNSHEDYLVCKKNSGIVAGDKLKFGPGGELDKETGQGVIAGIALDSPKQVPNADVYLVKCKIFGYKAKA